MTAKPVAFLLADSESIDWGRAPVVASGAPPPSRRHLPLDHHRAGTGVRKLAVRFGIHRDTVHNILVREGALRRRGIRGGQ
jgi:hypothetical protein